MSVTSCNGSMQSRKTPKTRRSAATYQGMENDLYAAYHENDHHLVFPVLDCLKEAKITVYDPHCDGMPNEPYLKAWLDRGIYNAKNSLIFLTKNFLAHEECTFQAMNSVVRFTQTKGIHRHRLVVVMMQTCKIPKYLRHFNCVYAWKYKESPQAQQTRILKALLEPKRSFRRGNITLNTSIGAHIKSLSPLLRRSSDGSTAIVTNTAATRNTNTPTKPVVNYMDLFLNAGKVKCILDNCELACVSEGCTYRCKGHDIRLFYQHLQMCKYQKVLCKHCKQSVYRKHLRRHEDVRCQHKRIACPHEDCRRLLSQKELEPHRRTCPFQELTCPNNHLGCETVFAKKDRGKHLEVCEYVQMFCKGCKAFYFRKDIYTHTCAQTAPNYLRGLSRCASAPDDSLPETFKCSNPGCDFTGPHDGVVVHSYQCIHKREQCPDCGARMAKKDLTWHRKECDRLVECDKCGMQVHSSAKLTHDRYICSGENSLTICEICHTVLDKTVQADHNTACLNNTSTTSMTVPSTNPTTDALVQSQQCGYRTGRGPDTPDSLLLRHTHSAGSPDEHNPDSDRRFTMESMLVVMETPSMPDQAATDNNFVNPSKMKLPKITPDKRRHWNDFLQMISENPAGAMNLLNSEQSVHTQSNHFLRT